MTLPVFSFFSSKNQKRQSSSRRAAEFAEKASVCPHQPIPFLPVASNRPCGYEMATRQAQGRSGWIEAIHVAPRLDFLGFWTKSHTKPSCPLVLVKILNLGICGEFRISPCSYPFFTFSSPKIVNHNSLDINSPLLVIVRGDFFIAKNTNKCLSNSV